MSYRTTTPSDSGGSDHYLVPLALLNRPGRFKTRGGALFVNGRNKHDQFITQTWKQAVAIQSVLSPYFVPLRMDVKPIICIHAQEIDDPGVVLEGVRIVGPRTLRKTLKKARRRLNENQVSKMAQALDALLKPA